MWVNEHNIKINEKITQFDKLRVEPPKRIVNITSTKLRKIEQYRGKGQNKNGLFNT